MTGLPTPTKDLPIHPFAEICELADGPQMHALRADIKERGQRVPIMTWRDSKGVLWLTDGRRRLVCCKAEGIEPVYYEFVGTEKELLAEVESLNLHRRHSNEAQRALAAANFANMKRGRPKIPQIAGLNSQSHSVPEAAKIFGVSEDAVERAKKIIKDGTDKLQEAVKDETISLSDAAKVTSESPQVQNRIVEQVRSGQASTAASAKPSKNGSLVFDWKRIEKPLGELIRAIEECGKAYGRKSEYRTCDAMAGKLATELASWREVITKTKPKEHGK